MGIFKTNSNPEEESNETAFERELRRSKATGLRDVIILFVVIIIVMLSKGAIGGNTISPVFTEEEIGIVGLDGVTHSFRYDEIKSIRLEEDLSSFKHGELVNGTESKRIYSGTFRNSEFGEYELHVDVKNHNYIVAHIPDGVIVFNVESADTTKTLYEYLAEDMKIPVE